MRLSNLHAAVLAAAAIALHAIVAAQATTGPASPVLGNAQIRAVPALWGPWQWMSGAAAQKSRPGADWGAVLAGPMEAWLHDAIVPGISIAVIDDGRVAWQGAFGFKDAATKAPVNQNTIFEAASLSKAEVERPAPRCCSRVSRSGALLEAR